MQIYSKRDAQFIVGKKVYLRPLKKTDIKQGWLDWINDPNSLDNLFGAFPVSEKDLKNYFDAQKLPESAMFGICTVKDNLYIGNARLSRIDWINKCCIYGRLIGNEDYKNKGYGSEALVLLLRYGFETLGLNRIYSSAIVTNKASIKSNLKVGMKKEGIFREASFKDGRFIDRLALSFLAKDFFKKYGQTKKKV